MTRQGRRSPQSFAQRWQKIRGDDNAQHDIHRDAGQAPANNRRGASTSMLPISDSVTPSAARRGRKEVHRKSSPRPPLARSCERRQVSLPRTIWRA